MNFKNSPLRKMLMDSERNRSDAWIHCYMYYMEGNRALTNKGAHRLMMRDFASGISMRFGIGSWRDEFTREFPGQRIPKECPPGWIPRGVSYRSIRAVLMRHDDYMFALSRGTAAVALTKGALERLPGDTRLVDAMAGLNRLTVHGVAYGLTPTMASGLFSCYQNLKRKCAKAGKPRAK